ncbi:hypothetical protein BJ165DRAFT_265396 [Panaeolus papilionaceus]|nr:hypothetical protein BJ165DRAFT_265396 [Panaeolus papilionaceus]
MIGPILSVPFSSGCTHTSASACSCSTCQPGCRPLVSVSHRSVTINFRLTLASSLYTYGKFCIALLLIIDQNSLGILFLQRPSPFLYLTRVRSSRRRSSCTGPSYCSLALHLDPPSRLNHRVMPFHFPTMLQLVLFSSQYELHASALNQAQTFSKSAAVTLFS